MADVLRQNILADYGGSYLKRKVLDLISEIRLEANILNKDKTDKAEYYDNDL